MVLIPILAASLVAGQSVDGQVQLPLEDYLSLIERAESAERARNDAARNTEPVVSELVSQQTTMTWSGDGVDITTTYAVELRGAPTRPIVLPVTGLTFRSTISPESDASLQADPSGLRFVAPAAGRYEIVAESRAALETERGVTRLALAPFRAPVGEYTLTLPDDLVFSCRGAVVAAESVNDGLRTVRFAMPRGDSAVVEARRDLEVDETVLATADVVTSVDLRADGPIRADRILYDVSRGELETFSITLPPGLSVERVATDEGEAPALVADSVLTIARTKKLAGSGFVSIVSRLDGPGDLDADLDAAPLAPVTPAVPVGARFLAVKTAIAADVAPLPPDRWLRVDVSDLPASARAKNIVAVWRLDGSDVDAALRIDRRPPASFLETVVDKRDSLSLLTADGTLVVRDRFHVRSDASAFHMRLAPETTIWSVQVNDLQVRPIARRGETLVPLSFGSDEAEVVEIVVVRNQKLPDDRAALTLSLPEIDAPVLTHAWRVLLPEGNLYRFSRGALSPVVIDEAPHGGSRFAVEPSARAIGRGGSSSISGRVFDESGYTLPGTTVSLYDDDTGWSGTVIADRNGAFSFVALRKGTYNLVAELSGFQTANYERLELGSGDNVSYAVSLGLATVAETIANTSPPPPLSSFADAALPSKEETAFEARASELKKGLVSGVKPVPVVIPETGKMLTLTGVMPATRVEVSLDVKPR